MPKELTHWTIAQRILGEMEESFIKTSILNHQEMFFIGAVALDTPYYLNGSYRPYFQALAGYLHGIHGENTFKPLGLVLKKYPDELPEPVLAFLSGILTHIMVDGEFHPLVYYLTGNYYHPNPATRDYAIASHRKWEAQLDIYYTNCFEIFQPVFLTNCLQHKKISDDELLDLLGLLYFASTSQYRNKIKQALITQAKLLERFTNRAFFKAYGLANILSQGRLYPTLALFYPSSEHVNMEQFRREFEYVHPQDMQKRKETLSDIEKRAIARSLQVIGKWASASSARELADIHNQMVGPSLETGG